MPVTIPVASHTMLSDFDNCPHKGFRKHILKDLSKQAYAPASAQGASGIDIHKAFAARLMRGRKLPENLQRWEPVMVAMAEHSPICEMPVAIKRDGEACGFFDNGVAVRGYADAVVFKAAKPNTAMIIDWKSGKKREDPKELKLHALMLKARYHTLDTVIGHYFWMQEPMGQNLGKAHDLSNFHETWAMLEQELDDVAYMIEKNNFPKQPNPLCPWCPVKDCEHHPGERK